MDRSFCVYLLKCADGSYYTGVTNDLERRLSEHEQGFEIGCYTYTRRPVQLVYNETYESPLDAIGREKQIKRWSRAKKQALAQEHWDRLSFLALRPDQKRQKGSAPSEHPSRASG